LSTTVPTKPRIAAAKPKTTHLVCWRSAGFATRAYR
jgi:hypothetical protein